MLHENVPQYVKDAAAKNEQCTVVRITVRNNTVVKEREVLKIVRTHVHPKRILEVSNKNKKEVWDTFFFNCEDFIQEIVDGQRNSDIRNAWKIAILGILLIMIID
jgi:hypothetical protein